MVDFERRGMKMKRLVLNNSTENNAHRPEENTTGDVHPVKENTRKKKILKGSIIVLLLMLTLVVTAAAVALVQARRVVASARKTVSAAQSAYAAGKNQDLVVANERLEEVKANVNDTHRRWQALAWIKFIPFVGNYWRDGDHALNAAQAGVEAADILADAVEPYADVLGFTGQGSFLGGSAEDRIVKAVETLDKVTPQLDTIAAKLVIVSDELEKINPKRYPVSVGGRRVDETILLAQKVAKNALFATTRAKPAIEHLPEVLGVHGERKYMVLFQNDAELRATGGFMTAYAILRVEKGKVFQEKSEDIYALDEKFNSTIPAPEIIRNYLPLVFRFNLRDMNLSPDFKVSMDEFSTHYNSLRGEPEIDGVIAVDTQILKDIVEILGPLEVPGYGTFTHENDARCDCPQIVYALEALADRPVATVKENRKGVLAPMLQTILMKSYGAPKQIWPSIVQTVLRNIGEKHVLFYMYEDAQQQAAELINVAGRIQDYEGDYFHLNDTNFAGAKSNMYTDHEVEQQYEVESDGTLTKTVTIKYQNPFPPSNCNLEAGELCLNGVLRDVVRVYVPQGSVLIEALGSENEVLTKEDLGKTVFEGFFTLRPQSQAKLIFKYRLPLKADGTLKLLIQKQPGIRSPGYRLLTPNQTQEFSLLTDRELILSF